jgi:hypothetical protein
VNELVTLDASDLDGVVGGEGPNVTTMTAGQQSQSVSRTDYAYCADTVRQACQTANPGFLGFGTNQQGAAQCTLQQMPQVCGTPPTSGQ